MNNSTVLKNELIFQYAAGNANMSKSLLASTYLFLNSKESSILSDFEDYCGEELKNYNEIKPINLTASDCIKVKKSTESISKIKNPLSIFINNYKSIKWKKIFNGFYDYSFAISNKEKAKLIKMEPQTRVPLHSHNGNEYILVLLFRKDFLILAFKIVASNLGFEPIKNIKSESSIPLIDALNI